MRGIVHELLQEIATSDFTAFRLSRNDITVRHRERPMERGNLLVAFEYQLLPSKESPPAAGRLSDEGYTP